MSATGPAQSSAARDANSGSRKQSILLGSAIAFGQHGVRGTSLREIACAAGVSLTLLSHHFGCKLSLLASVVETHQQSCLADVAQLRSRLLPAIGTVTVSELVNAWLDYEFAHYGTPLGAPYLRLLVRLQDDPEVNGDMRATLHGTRAVAIEGLHRIFPRAEDQQIQSAWHLASACVHAAILHAMALSGDGALDDDVRAGTERFVLAGLHSVFDPPSASPVLIHGGRTAGVPTETDA